MSLNSHVAELNAKHAQIEAEITEEMNHPAMDDLRVAALKKQKLRIKEEIRRLAESPPTRH